MMRMKRTKLLASAALAPALLLGGRGLAAGATAAGTSVYQATLMEPDQKTEEISTDELRQILADGSAVVYDSRGPAFAIGHIPGALNQPKPGVQPAAAGHAAGIQELLPDRAAAIVLYCNGVYCPLSKRLGEVLSELGFTNVRRYQLGLPVWRALGGVVEIEPEGIRYVRQRDPGAVFVDARDPAEFQAGSLPGARNSPLAAVADATVPLPLADVTDLNHRIVVFGADRAQARAVAEPLARRGALPNVAYFTGDSDALLAIAASG
jgi:rhodanese-related sulfurtransferase